MKKNDTVEEIKRLINQLGSKNGFFREKSRKALVKIGKPAVPALIELLANPKPLLRWEACKALVSIKDPTAAEQLVSVLNDENMEVRWVAAEALIAVKENCLIPLLHSLKDNFNSLYLRESAHHILYALRNDDVLDEDTQKVLKALRLYEPGISVAVAAHKVLNSLEKLRSKYPKLQTLTKTRITSSAG